MLCAWPPVKVVQQRAVGLRRHDAEVDLDPARDDVDLFRAVGQDLFRERRLREGVRQGLGVGAGGDDVDVADGLLHAAQGARQVRPLGRRVRADELEDAPPERARLVQQHPALVGVVLFGGLQDTVLALLTEALQRGEASLLQACDLLDARHAELAPEAPGRARADAGQPRDLHEAHGHLLGELGQNLGGPVLREVPDHRRRRPADVRERLQVLDLAHGPA
jgi:hypothetical protein